MPNDKRVLLVDDDRDIVRGVGIRLRAAGYEIAVAHDGRAGLSAALEMKPDAIVLDMRMPIMDGFAVLRELRRHAETAAIPVVVLSTSNAESDIARAYQLHANSYLVKPDDYDAFVQLMDELGRYWLTWNEAP